MSLSFSVVFYYCNKWNTVFCVPSSYIPYRWKCVTYLYSLHSAKHYTVAVKFSPRFGKFFYCTWISGLVCVKIQHMFWCCVQLSLCHEWDLRLSCNEVFAVSALAISCTSQFIVNNARQWYTMLSSAFNRTVYSVYIMVFKKQCMTLLLLYKYSRLFRFKHFMAMGMKITVFRNVMLYALLQWAVLSRKLCYQTMWCHTSEYHNLDRKQLIVWLGNEVSVHNLCMVLWYTGNIFYGQTAYCRVRCCMICIFQSGNKTTLYHLHPLLFYVFFGHLCYQNICISQKCIWIAYTHKSTVIVTCSISFCQYFDAWRHFRLIMHDITVGSTILTHCGKLQQFNILLKMNNRVTFVTQRS
jgi:hypothetical protein